MRKTAVYLPGEGSPETFAHVRAQGFDAVDLQSFVDTETPLFTQGAAHFERTLTALRRAAEAAGIEIAQTHGPWRRPQDTTPADRAERLEKMKMSLRGTALLGCRYMAIHPIMPFMYEVDDAQRMLYYEMNRAFFAELIREAERCGVVICFENLPFKGLPTSSPTATAAFVREMASPYFQMCLDTGHSIILGEAPGEALRRNADVIRILHVHDNDRLHDQHRLPYDGVIDWTDFRDALSAVDESVVLSLECDVPARMPAPLRDGCRRALCGVARGLAGR